MSAINKLFNFIAGVMFTLQVFSAGADFADNHVSEGVINLVLAAFWGGILLIDWLAMRSELKTLRKLDQKADKIFRDLGRAIDEAEASKKNDFHYLEVLEAVTKEVAGGKKLTKAMIPKIEKAFHEKTQDYWVKLAMAKNGKLDAEVSNQPFTAPKKAAPGRSARHDAAAKRGDAARAKVNKQSTKKKGTK